jgi:lysylphosphatidylglycerol synthetase-like protein (DUF2156 family)
VGTGYVPLPSYSVKAGSGDRAGRPTHLGTFATNEAHFPLPAFLILCEAQNRSGSRPGEPLLVKQRFRVSHRATLMYGAITIHVSPRQPGAHPVTRRLGALLTALAGVMNIVSALYPAVPARMEILSDILPLTVIRGAQSATVLVGFALILVADGLRKRRRRALQIAVLALLLSALFHLTKGLDFEEAIVALSLAWLLTREHETFSVPSRMVVPGRLFSRVHAIVALYVAYIVGGFVILRREIMPAPSMLHVVQEPFRLLGDAAYYHYLTPQARWFERSITGFACCVALYVVLRVLRPLIPNHSATASGETRRFLFDHLSSFYQLKSLYQFNDKFAPDWCSRYLTYRDVLKIPRLALAIAQSEDPIRLPTISGMLKREV